MCIMFCLLYIVLMHLCILGCSPYGGYACVLKLKPPVGLDMLAHMTPTRGDPEPRSCTMWGERQKAHVRR